VRRWKEVCIEQIVIQSGREGMQWSVFFWGEEFRDNGLIEF
jgi:hypothetical protein